MSDSREHSDGIEVIYDTWGCVRVWRVLFRWSGWRHGRVVRMMEDATGRVWVPIWWRFYWRR